MRITKLDGLRGIFSVMVVFHHFTPEILPSSIYNNFFVRQSWLFVDLFFILSGFVIALNYPSIDQRQSFISFIKKRFIRLYPLLFFSVATFLLFKLVGHYFFDGLIHTPGTLSDNLGLSFETLLFTNSTPILGTSPGMNYPSWSISSEMISYLAYGSILLFIPKRISTISFLAVIGGSICTLLYIGTLHLNYTSDFGFLRGFISFFIGVLIFKSYRQKSFTLNSNFEYLSIALIIFCFYLMSTNLYSNNYYYAIPFFLGFSILVLTKTNGLISKILEKEIFQFLGRISYSMYLNHGLIIIIIPRILFNLFKFNVNLFSQTLVILVSMIVVIIFSHFTYLLIELRGGRFLKNLLL